MVLHNYDHVSKYNDINKSRVGSTLYASIHYFYHPLQIISCHFNKNEYHLRFPPDLASNLCQKMLLSSTCSSTTTMLPLSFVNDQVVDRSGNIFQFRCANLPEGLQHQPLSHIVDLTQLHLLVPSTVCASTTLRSFSTRQR